MFWLMACASQAPPVAPPVPAPAPEIAPEPVAEPAPLPRLSELIFPVAPGGIPAELLETLRSGGSCELSLLALPGLSRQVLATLPDCPESILVSATSTWLLSPSPGAPVPGHLVDLAHRSAVALPPSPAKPPIENPDSWEETLSFSDNDPILSQGWGVGEPVLGTKKAWSRTITQTFALRDGAWVAREPGTPAGAEGTLCQAGDFAPAGTLADGVELPHALDAAAGVEISRRWTTASPLTKSSPPPARPKGTTAAGASEAAHHGDPGGNRSALGTRGPSRDLVHLLASHKRTEPGRRRLLPGSG